MTLYSLVGGHRCFEVIYCLLLQDTDWKIISRPKTETRYFPQSCNRHTKLHGIMTQENGIWINIQVMFLELTSGSRARRSLARISGVVVATLLKEGTVAVSVGSFWPTGHPVGTARTPKSLLLYPDAPNLKKDRRIRLGATSDNQLQASQSFLRR
jgi:hypothetical protein